LSVNLTLHLDKHWEKFSKIPNDEEKIKWIQSWMRNQTRWNNTQFNKDIRLISTEEEWDFSLEGEGDEYISAYVDSASIEIGSEDVDESVKNWIIDLGERHSERDCDRLIKIRQIYLTLPLHEKVLYDMYFTHMKSLREIAKELKLPLSSVHSMMTELKNNIKNGLE
jgi:DNA-directed RNA polymerase specialized sigma subunit